MGNAPTKTPVQGDNTIPDPSLQNGEGPLRSSQTNKNKSNNKNKKKLENKQAKDDKQINKDCRDDEEANLAPQSSKISDDQIQVNLAMADLMAYLQVVANNSSHLPLTRRDDPELDRTVTSLSNDDYAQKSSAFIPSDVRVIGGVFTRYGRVWDLPTSEEYKASDGAHEPGRSYGGACCNSLLKVVYDAAANDAATSGHGGASNKALFEDDDDEDESTLGKSYKSGFSLEYISPSSIRVTWADLLRQMKAEFKEVGYSQLPKITTTRKFDLNKAFSLVPDNFDDSKGTKRSLLIGCNYTNVEGAQLNASHDDIRSMKDYIVNVHGFPESKDKMTVLLDDGECEAPTFMNIIEAFKSLSERSQPGDAVFVQFSGHGGRVLDSTEESEAESYDEAIVPSDYQASGIIRDTLIFKTLLAPMRYGVTVTIVIDCCDTGMMMELPFCWNPKSEKRESIAKLSMNEDFSFVRLLKVVKTLYETSTFTQLGKTVGSALGPMMSELEKDNMTKTTLHDEDGESAAEEMMLSKALSHNGTSILDAIAEACSPSKNLKGKKGQSSKSKKSDSNRSKESLLEKVMNCTILEPGEDEYSDDEEGTFKSRTDEDNSYEDGYTDTGESFESLTDDGYNSSARNRRNRRKR